MNHIEFFGPPGSGKSSVHKELIKEGRLFGGIQENALTRFFLKKAKEKKLPSGHVYKKMPKRLQRFLNNKFFKHRFINASFPEFITENPKFLSVLDSALKITSFETKKVIRILINTAGRYQVSKHVKRECEELVMDEGFSQRLLSILWRTEDDKFSETEYFSAVPKPNRVIYVNAPVNLCIQRQENRKRVISGGRTKQKEAHEICSSIVEFLESKGVEIIKIENTGDVRCATKRIKQHLKGENSYGK